MPVFDEGDDRTPVEGVVPQVRGESRLGAEAEEEGLLVDEVTGADPCLRGESGESDPLAAREPMPGSDDDVEGLGEQLDRKSVV